MLPRAIRRLNAEHSGARIAGHVPSPDTIWWWASTGQCDLGLVRPRSGYAEPFLTVDAVRALFEPLGGLQLPNIDHPPPRDPPDFSGPDWKS